MMNWIDKWVDIWIEGDLLSRQISWTSTDIMNSFLHWENAISRKYIRKLFDNLLNRLITHFTNIPLATKTDTKKVAHLESWLVSWTEIVLSDHWVSIPALQESPFWDLWKDSVIKKPTTMEWRIIVDKEIPEVVKIMKDMLFCIDYRLLCNLDKYFESNDIWFIILCIFDMIHKFADYYGLELWVVLNVNDAPDLDSIMRLPLIWEIDWINTKRKVQIKIISSQYAYESLIFGVDEYIYKQGKHRMLLYPWVGWYASIYLNHSVSKLINDIYYALIWKFNSFFKLPQKDHFEERILRDNNRIGRNNHYIRQDMARE